MSLTLHRIIEVNRARCERWHRPDTEPWSLADWSNAMCGEAGETANVVKKLRRHETNTASAMDADPAVLHHNLGYEIADTIFYALLLADAADIDIEGALVEKFNLVSASQGFPERL